MTLRKSFKGKGSYFVKFQKFITLVTICTLSSIVLAPATYFAESTTTDQTSETTTNTSDTTSESSSTSTSATTSESSTTGSTTQETTSTTEQKQTNSTAEKSEDHKSSTATQTTIPKVEEKPASWTSKPALEQTTVVPSTSTKFSYNQSTDEFIQKIGDEARQIAHDNDLYASVMIAQAILESGSGNSGLAATPNFNLFGIKGEYKGTSVTMKTQEDDGSGKLYTIDSAFRKYPSYKESLEDYAQLLKKGLSGNSDFYHGVWKSQTTSYHEATKALTGKYATDTKYNEKLDQLIEVYHLTNYDQLKAGGNQESNSNSSSQKITPQPADAKSVRTSDKVQLLKMYPSKSAG
ncbi:hypothetical protein CBF30_04735 [Vagococcus entomophilus]|uniref:Mannosyl-glycoprotein endo-beta-N-acetylglucosamidase-like domain-containing protein n=1 Tax=Vagococcus entomophilus TaxID=1160095 RepID=A0A430AKP3_9ENTE|nr:hypothetical protein CBF30_04735 [Vagococcus entomophilus]